MGFFARLLGTQSRPRALLTDLAEDYRAEHAQALALRRDAERARYPQAAETLRRLADIEIRHAEWLRDRLVALGGDVPAPPPLPHAGANQWERACAALKSAQDKRRRLLEQITYWDPEEPELVALLRRILHEDQREQPVYEGLIMRSDPQSVD